ncbi:hypothetical protein [Corynebacterium sp. CCUG 70398]|uniref:hypothetical protein n=1 Tax=Corynebacterium sp. CCUG 70398 TaxID=2823891 RepID=UPI00210E2E49|nr:hypothetical protein [Corynebacterium sp. CCUG 70398]MCQ4623948.1 hypothetical protein [Corynebacterium sp. CCUG 70398]
MWSAQRIGRQIGKTAMEVNKILAELGFQEGSPGAWQVTEKGESHQQVNDHHNGYGGFAARSWAVTLWDDFVAETVISKYKRKQ